MDELILDARVKRQKRHTARGKLSVILFVCGACLFGLALFIAINNTHLPGFYLAQRMISSQNYPSFHRPGQFMVAGSFLLFLSGFMMAIAGSFSKKKNRNYAIAGLVLNGGVLMVFVVLLFVSLSKYQ